MILGRGNNEPNLFIFKRGTLLPMTEAAQSAVIPASGCQQSRAIGPRYLRYFVLAIALWISLFAAATLVIDPYGISPIHVTIPHVNRYKPKRLDIDRLIKPYEVWRYQPRTVFLGTSRIHQSIDPAGLDGSRYAPAYNASVPAVSLGMNISYLNQYLRLDHNLRYVFVELFLYNFLGQDQTHPPISLIDMIENSAVLFFSYDTAWDTLYTLWYNVQMDEPCYEIKPGGYFYYPPGEPKDTFNGFPAGMLDIDRKEHGNPTLSEPSFATVDELIETAKRDHVQLTFLMTPEHPYFWYYIDSIDRWDLITDWLKHLTAMTSILSFAQPNAWTYESVRRHMTYWNDPFHFSLAMGRGIESEIAGTPEPGLPQGFMVRLTPAGVDSYVAGQREAVRNWARQHPHFVAAFEAEKKKSRGEREP
jgi:hypothetical protein